MIKKMALSIVVLLLLLPTGFIAEVHADTPNAKECIEGNADCPDLEESIPSESDDTENNTSNSISKESNGSLIFDLIKMVFALLIILGLIYGLLKFLNKRNKLFQKVKALENLGGISVGPNKSIQIVRIGSKVYLIGVGENVEMLHEVTDEEVKHELLHNNEQNEFQTGTLFTTLFQSKADKDEASNNDQKSDFKKLFSTELDKLKQGRKKIINQYKHKEDKHE